MSENNPVSHPSHYTKGKYEVILILKDFLENSGLDPYTAYLLGTAIVYQLRSPHKEDFIQDLQKARQYLTMIIEGIE